MKYLYTWARMPTDNEILHKLCNACSRLEQKLAKLDLNSLGISEYNQQYLRNKIASLEHTLQLYGYLVLLSLSPERIDVDDCTVLDYGGGSGIFSFLAKEMGVGRVIYNDIYDVSCRDVKQLGRALSLELDDVVCGDVDDLISYVKEHSIIVNAIASYDVIEHIYDIKDFLRKMALLSRFPFRVVHASGANTKNPFYVRRTTRIQTQAEYKGIERKWGWKERDTLRSYLDIRREIIRSYQPDLSRVEVEELARRTRGLRKDDIERSIDEYREKGDITYCPDHPSNTCDPYTGNWAEHLMKTELLEQTLADSDFSVRILSGYYGSSGGKPKRIIKNLFNVVIRILGRKALIIAPYYVVCADYNASQSAAPDGYSADAL